MSTKKTADIKPDFISARFEPDEWNNADLSYPKLFIYIIMNPPFLFGKLFDKLLKCVPAYDILI